MCKGWGIKPSQPPPQGVSESVNAPIYANKNQTEITNNLDLTFYPSATDFAAEFRARSTVDFSADTSDLGEDKFSLICDDRLESRSSRNSFDYSDETPSLSDDELAGDSPAELSDDLFDKLSVSASKLEATDEEVTSVCKEEVYEGISSQDEGVGGATAASHEVATLTDVCYQDGIAEVDLVSLIEEQLPKYVLRADTITDFTGYDNNDWGVKTPALDPETPLDLSPELIEETLKYFILCSERVGQMTRTYNDIEAVTRLLQEKEQDLELAARIGQGLLEKNKHLESRNEQLEQLLQEANDKIFQLRHDISMKDALLQVYVQDYESESTPSPGDGTPGFGVGTVTMHTLQNKIKNLEDENLELKVQTARISNDTTVLEEKEEHLMGDCVRHLEDLNSQMKEMQEEMSARSELSVKQQEEVTHLLSKVVNLESTNRKLNLDNTELQKHNEALESTQKELATEISQLEEQYGESQALLHESKEEVKSLRKKAKPSVIHQHYGTAPFFMPEGSLALELQKTAHEEDCPEGYKPSERKQHNKGVMDTARCVRKTSRRTDSMTSSISNMSLDVSSISNRSSMYMGDESESDIETPFSAGRPGIPGSNDLETALRKLALRRANEINEKSLMDARAKRTRQSSVVDDDAPTPCQTPDSYMSIGSGSNLSDFSRLSGAYRMPEKLQIVKPMEGSHTLHQWQRLATPHLGGILDSRPGIQTKGGRKLDIGDEEIYSLSDYEEDGTWNLSFSACSDTSGLGSLGEGSDWWRDSGVILRQNRKRVKKVQPRRRFDSVESDNKIRQRKRTSTLNEEYAQKTEQLPKQRNQSNVRMEDYDEQFVRDGGYYPSENDLGGKRRSKSNPWQWSSQNRCAVM